MGKRKSTKGQTTIYKTYDRVTRTPLKSGGELRCPRRASSFSSTSDTMAKRTNKNLQNIQLNL